MNNTVTVNIRNRQYQGDLLEIQGSDTVDPSSIEEPIGEVIGLGDGIHVADYIEGYDFTNEFDITAALKKAISKAWEISKLRYAQAKKHPREPVIAGREPGYWTKSGSAHAPTIIIPEGAHRVYEDIYIPGHFALIGEAGWNSVIRFMNGARLHVLGTFTADFGVVQPIGGCIKDLKIVPDGEKRNFPTVNIYGNLSNWAFDHVHIMNSSNAASINLYHHKKEGLVTPFGTTETKGNVHLKECDIRNCQFEYGRGGILIRDGFNCHIYNNKMIYVDHGIHMSNGRQSNIYNNAIIYGGAGSRAIGITASTTAGNVIPIHGNHIHGYKKGMLCNFKGNRLVHYINTFEKCEGYDTYDSIFHPGPWKSEDSAGMFVEGYGIWLIGSEQDPY